MENMARMNEIIICATAIVTQAWPYILVVLPYSNAPQIVSGGKMDHMKSRGIT